MGRGQSGFTLIEVLVATAMLIIVIGGIYGAFRAGSQSSTMIEEDADLHQTARVLLGRINEELYSLYTQPNQQGLSLVGESSVENGGPPHLDTLTFTTVSHRQAGGNQAAGDVCGVYYSVEYTQDGKRLGLFVREDYTPTLHIDSSDVDKLPQTRLSELVVGMDCAYLDPSTGDWVDQWDTTQTQLPEAVRVQFILRSRRVGAKPIVVAMTTNLPISAAAQNGPAGGVSSAGQ